MLRLEREYLRSVCSSHDPPLARGALLHLLASHIWQDPEHRVIYEALCRFGNRAASAIRQELPAIATRMGFPDVDWTPYFECKEARGAADIEVIAQSMVAASLLGSPRK